MAKIMKVGRDVTNRSRLDHGWDDNRAPAAADAFKAAMVIA